MKYYIYKYYNDIVRDEPINIGVAIYGNGILIAKFDNQLEKIKILYPKYHSSILAIIKVFNESLNIDKNINYLTQSYMSSIQVISNAIIIKKTLEEELEDLYRIFIHWEKP